MKTPHNPASICPVELVENLDDATLKSGHALLDNHRSSDFSAWIDHQLHELESRFEEFWTRQSFRKSLGR